MEPVPEGMLIRKCSAAQHAVSGVYDLLVPEGSIDVYWEQMRGS